MKCITRVRRLSWLLVNPRPFCTDETDCFDIEVASCCVFLETEGFVSFSVVTYRQICNSVDSMHEVGILINEFVIVCFFNSFKSIAYGNINSFSFRNTAVISRLSNEIFLTFLLAPKHSCISTSIIKNVTLQPLINSWITEIRAKIWSVTLYYFKTDGILFVIFSTFFTSKNI